MQPDWEIANGKLQSVDLEKQYIKSTPKSSSWEPNRSTAFLDGLRGLAAFLVYIYHFNVGWYGEEILHGYGENGHYSFTLLPFIRTFYSGGIAAVAIFFVLSGFVLTISPLRKIRDHTAKQSIYRSLISSVIRRPVRLYLPCLLVVWTFVILRQTWLIPVTSWPPPPSSPIGLELIDATWSFIVFFNPLRAHFVTIPFMLGVHYWTIPIELKGSLLVFALVAYSVEEVNPRRDLLRLVVTGILLHQMGQWAMSLFVFGMCLAICEAYDLHLTDLPSLRGLSSKGQTALNTFVFFLGWWLCSHVDRNVDWSRATPSWYILTSLIPKVYMDDEYFRYWVGYGAVLMVYGILRLNWLQRFFALRLLTWLGKISFVLYLTHTIVMMITGDWCRRLVGQPTFLIQGELGTYWYDNKVYMPDIGPMGLNVRWLGCLALTTPMCLVVAHFATDIYDKSGLRGARWLARKCGYER